MAQGIKQDLILKEKESKLPNYIQFNWIKSWDKLGRIDSLFWQKNCICFDWIFEKVESNGESSLVEIGVMCATASSW